MVIADPAYRHSIQDGFSLRAAAGTREFGGTGRRLAIDEDVDAALACGSLGRRIAWQSHLIDVILDQLRIINVAPLQLPLPDDPRALRVAGILLANPAYPRPLARISRSSGAGRRTIERLFVDGTGMTFGKWRQQLRLMQAMRLLGAGAKVTHAALEAGYSTPSAFIVAFRKAFSSTPTEYFTGASGN